MSQHTRRLRAVLAGASVLVATLTACGTAGPVGERLVGVHDAPAERTGSAISPERAEEEMTAALERAAAASQEVGDAGERSRGGAYIGPARYEADRIAEFLREGGKAGRLVAGAKDAQVLAISRGAGWPRVLLGTQRVGNLQKLFFIVSREPAQPYKVFAVTDMGPGEQVPALPPLEKGAVLVVGSQGLVASPRLVAHRWAKAVAFPNPAEPEGVMRGDDFTTALRTNAADQQKALGRLATLNQSHRGIVGGSMAFRLEGGGAVSLSAMRRRDVVETTDKAQRLELAQGSALRSLINKAAVTDRIEIWTLETVAFNIPAEGKARLIGAREQMSSAWGH